MSGVRIVLALTAMLAVSPLLPASVHDAGGAPGGAAAGGSLSGTPRAEVPDRLEPILRSAQAGIRRAWEAEIASFDGMHQHLLAMADMRSSGMFTPLR